MLHNNGLRELPACPGAYCCFCVSVTVFVLARLFTFSIVVFVSVVVGVVFFICFLRTFFLLRRLTFRLGFLRLQKERKFEL